jgi:hypothetical protein
MLETMKVVSAIEVPPHYTPRSAQDEALRFARTCYDHLAGRPLVWTCCLEVNECSADLAWTRASADIMLPDAWARNCGDDARSLIGWSEDATPARCASRWRAVPACTRHLGWTPLNSSKRRRYIRTPSGFRSRKRAVIRSRCAGAREMIRRQRAAFESNMDPRNKE